MLKQMSTRLLAEPEKELGMVSVQVTDPLERLVQSLSLTRDALGKLKAMVLAQGFADESAEVDFFKQSDAEECFCRPGTFQINFIFIFDLKLNFY